MRGLRLSLRRLSLRDRLSWSASAVVAGWVLLLALGANLLLSSALAGQADSVLQARAQATALTIDVTPTGAVTVDEGQDDTALDVGTWIFAADGTLVEGPPGSSERLDRAARELAGTGEGTTEIGDEDPLRLYALPVVEQGNRIATVVTSTSLAPYRQLERLAVWGSVGVALLLLVIVHLVLRANVGRALRPVQEMSAQAARWSADDVDRRFLRSPRPAELAELAATLDGLLDRLSAVLRHEQRLTDELSHELRTPLARLRAEVELARGRPPGDPVVADGLAATDAAAGEMQQIIETLLTSARAGTRAAPGRAAATRPRRSTSCSAASVPRPDAGSAPTSTPLSSSASTPPSSGGCSPRCWTTRSGTPAPRSPSTGSARTTACCWSWRTTVPGSTRTPSTGCSSPAGAPSRTTTTPAAGSGWRSPSG